MNITFKSENGYCPYFIYKDYKFYIYESRDYQRNWQYSLCLKRLQSEVKTFDSPEEALNYINGIKGIKFVYDGLYETRLHDYVIDGKKVIIRAADKQLTGEFDTYLDCLKYSKEYIEKFIKTQEPEQLSMFSEEA